MPGPVPGPAPGLRVDALRVRFPSLERPALDVPRLCVAAGETLAITGPSGSGKTTLVNILCGLERAKEGAVRWGETDLAALSEGARDRWRAQTVGLVMQEFHLFAGLSTLDNVLLPKRLRHFRLPARFKAEARALLARVGVERTDQRVETLSRGQMQRVAVARALLGNPSVLVADEPTASLDAGAGEAVATLLLDLSAERGATLVVATHDRAVMARMGRALALEGGRVASDTAPPGPPAPPRAPQPEERLCSA